MKVFCDQCEHYMYSPAMPRIGSVSKHCCKSNPGAKPNPISSTPDWDDCMFKNERNNCKEFSALSTVPFKEELKRTGEDNLPA